MTVKIECIKIAKEIDENPCKDYELVREAERIKVECNATESISKIMQMIVTELDKLTTHSQGR